MAPKLSAGFEGGGGCKGKTNGKRSLFPDGHVLQHGGCFNWRQREASDEGCMRMMQR